FLRKTRMVNPNKGKAERIKKAFDNTSDSFESRHHSRQVFKHETLGTKVPFAAICNTHLKLPHIVRGESYTVTDDDRETFDLIVDAIADSNTPDLSDAMDKLALSRDFIPIP
ncbi:hypothetical protein, partial [Pseudomonas simiae]|uniref:hypothetical protein n=1 Tax=Pseudomonas simiae TaxID=321846 RepID=UPI001F2CE1CC